MIRYDDRDPDVTRDAWTTDEIAARAAARTPRTQVMPPSVVAAEERRLAEARAGRVEPTLEERRARNERWMNRMRGTALLGLFRESRRF